LFRCKVGEEEGENRWGWSGHILTFTNKITNEIFFICESVGNSIGEVDTSLYEHPDLNPFIIPPVKSSTRTFMSLHLIFYMGFPWYISMKCFCRYVLMVLASELIKLVNIPAKYEQKNSISNVIVIHWISGSVYP
jgi:hypothetical protein